MYKHFFKRLIDLLLALVLSPIAVLAVVLCAPFIHFYDRGPVFYPAKRRGKNGRIFKMLKLRTMRVNAEDIRNPDGSAYTGRNDPRVTPVGRILRRTSIDELPQIFNVLIGDMSFVGPRPHLATTDYEDLDENRKKRLTVRPGITGYSQAYFRNSITSEEKIALDCVYADRISLLFDIRILFRTAISVIEGKNVYGSEAASPPSSQHQSKK